MDGIVDAVVKLLIIALRIVDSTPKKLFVTPTSSCFGCLGM